MSRVRNLVDFTTLTHDFDGDGTLDFSVTGTLTGGAVSSPNVPEVDLSIAPEVLEIQVSAPAAGQATTWLWTWEQSTLPYARRTITNSPEVSVPLYRQGQYVVNNFAAYDLFDQMTQTHSLYLKWIDGAGTDNLVSWATSAGPISDSHPDINGGNATDVQRITVNVPATITLPTLTPPNVTYTVTNNGTGAYTFSGPALGDNPNIGPLYRGGTYTFNVTATGHPFYFTTDNGTNFASGTYFGEYTDGVTGSRTDSGTVTIVVPNDAPDTLYYQCGNHGVMRGAITVKNLAVETNINGNPVVYFQHTQEGHKTPVELRPIPSLVNQMCIVYDASVNKFVPQDLATYVENTPSFENKIREVAGTAELVVEDGSAVIAKVNVYDDSTYLPLVGNNPGDQAFATDTDILYIWDGSAWQQAGAANTDDLAEGTTNLFYTDARVNTYLSSNGYDTATNIVASITDSAPATLDTLNELAAALGDDPNFATTVTNNIAAKLPLSGGTLTGDLIINTPSNGILKLQEGGSDKGYIGAGGGGLYIKNLAGDVIFRNSSDADTIRIKDSGNVGIGTTNPDAQLHVNTTRTSSTNATSFILSDNVTGIQTDGVYKSIRSTSNNGNSISEIRFIETDGTNNNTAIAFATQSTAGGLTERLRVHKDGNVGIGTSSPTNPLHVNGTSRFLDTAYFSSNLTFDRWAEGSGSGGVNIKGDSGTHIAIASNHSEGYANLYLNRIDVTSDITSNNNRFIDFYYDGVSAVRVRGNSSNDLSFDMHGGGNFVIPNGNVGIGTLTPASRLHVHDPAKTLYTGSSLGNASIMTSGADGILQLLSVDDDSTWAHALTFKRYRNDTGATISGYGFSTFTNTGNQNANTFDRMGLHYGANDWPQENAEIMTWKSNGRVGIGSSNPQVSLVVGGTDALQLPVGTTAQRPSGARGYTRVNSTNDILEYHNGSAWIQIGVADGSSYSSAAANANDLIDLGITTSGEYWINLPGSGPTLVYCDMQIDGGGWMMLGYAGSTSGVGNSNHMVFHQIGNIATSRTYGQTSFSRFDYARAMPGAGTNSWLMWKRTSDDNILVHTVDGFWEKMPGGSSAGNMDFGGGTSGLYPITTMKMSNTGNNVLDIKAGTAGAGTRYENGPSYPGIAWNSPYNQNTDSGQSYSSQLNRRSLLYWETNGPEGSSQWFHGTPLMMGDGNTSPTGGQSRKDIEIYFRVRTP